YQDFNADGAFDTTTTIANLGGTNTNNPPSAGTVPAAIDSGVAGVTVRLFDAGGALVDTQTSAANGTWTSNATTPGQKYRVEFSGLAGGFFSGPHGASNGTSTQFVSDGAANVNLGILRAADYYRTNPLLLTQVYIFGGQNSATSSLISF